jgi:hypothetical protein
MNRPRLGRRPEFAHQNIHGHGGNLRPHAIEFQHTASNRALDGLSVQMRDALPSYCVLMR